MRTDEDVGGALATEARLHMRAMGQIPPPSAYVYPEAEREHNDALTAQIPPRLDASERHQPPTTEDLDYCANLAQNFDEANPGAKPCEEIVLDRGSGEVTAFVPNLSRPEWSRKPFLRADVLAGGAAAHGTWVIRQRGVSRERRSQASSKTRGNRAGPRRPRSSNDPPPLARIRGFTAASARLVVHLERRRAAMRAA